MILKIYTCPKIVSIENRTGVRGKNPVKLPHRLHNKS